MHKVDKNQWPKYSRRNILLFTIQCLVIISNGIGYEKLDIYMSHFSIHLKLTEHYKLTMLQLFFKKSCKYIMFKISVSFDSYFLFGCMFLEIYPFLLGFPVCWHITVHSILSQFFAISVMSINCYLFAYISYFVYLGPDFFLMSLAHQACCLVSTWTSFCRFISSFVPLWSETMLGIISILLDSLRFVLLTSVLSVVCSAVWGYSVL